MVDAGVKLGLPRAAAVSLARQTAFGAGKLLAESDDSPEILRRKVTSPGGTTFAAISRMEDAGLKAIVVAAVEAAAAKAKELGR
jgi:pyrroline-5-carboxylate reductase